jgi:signal transduction histidine kinase
VERITPGLSAGFGDTTALHELMRVLFANIATHTPETTSVTFTIGPTPDLKSFEVTLSDTGPGVFADAHEKLFDPFQGRAPRGSSGLGLAIARAIALSHGGTISAAPTQPRGLTITIVIPRPPG